MLQQLIDELQGLLGRIKRGRSVNVNDRETKASAVALATMYFETVRPTVVGGLGESDVVKAHDVHWQDLVRLAHGNNKRRTYVATLATLNKELKTMSVAVLSRAAGRSSRARGSDLTPSEDQLITTLEQLLPTAAASYRQGLLDLKGQTRLSYRGTAAEFREALRETLDHLAPDADVMAQSGFKLEPGQLTPTMKQKVRFVMSSRGRGSGQRAVAEKSVGGVDELTGDIMRATYNRASIATHLETTRGEVLRIKRYVDTVLFDLLEIAE